MMIRFSVGLMMLAAAVGGHAEPDPTNEITRANGAVGFTFTLPESRGEVGEPLLTMGKPGRGEVVFCRVLRDGRTVFGWYQTGASAFLSDPIQLPPHQPLEMVVSLGNAYTVTATEGQTTAAALRRLVLLQVQGRTVLLAKNSIREPDGPLRIGVNEVGGPFAAAKFSGQIAHVHQVNESLAAAVAFSPSSLIAEDSVEREKLEYPGPLVLQISLPSNASGRSEPLITTGKTGAGDLVFIRYVDEAHVQFGFDHWLKGGPVSEILPCDYAAVHDVTISMGSLLPPAGTAAQDSPSEEALRRRCVVIFDGKRVMDWGSPFYPTKEEDIALGSNPIGASTADAFFNGTIRKVMRSKAESISPVN